MNVEETPLSYRDMMVSYAGFGEDVMLRRFFGDQASGFFVDIGAHDPINGSVTQHFVLSGWRGVNVEPLRPFYERLVLLRPNDVNLNIAVSDHIGTLELVVNHTEPGLSSATQELVDTYERAGHRLERITVPARPLDDVIQTYCADRVVDFLKIDAEGHELEILRGTDLFRFRPRLILIEAGYKPEAWEQRFENAGYILAGTDPWNRYYIRPEEAARASLLAHPANIADRYVRFEYARAMQQQAQWESMGPLIRNIARTLRTVKDASPGVTRVAKRLLASLSPRLFRESPHSIPRARRTPGHSSVNKRDS